MMGCRDEKSIETRHHSEWKNKEFYTHSYIPRSILVTSYNYRQLVECRNGYRIPYSSILNDVLFLCFFHPYIPSFFGKKFLFLVGYRSYMCIIIHKLHTCTCTYIHTYTCTYTALIIMLYHEIYVRMYVHVQLYTAIGHFLQI